MKSLKNMNAMMAMIVLCVVGSLVLGWLGWEQHQRAGHLRDVLGLNDKDQVVNSKMGLIEQQAREIQLAANQYTELTKQLEGDNLRGDNTPLTYIRGIASNRLIALGAVNINPRTDKQRSYTDNVYTVIPKSLNAGSRSAPTFQRTQLANFMYKLEEGSQRVKVTSLRIDTAKPLKPEEIPDDRWSFQCSITLRSKE